MKFVLIIFLSVSLTQIAYAQTDDSVDIFSNIVYKIAPSFATLDSALNYDAFSFDTNPNYRDTIEVYFRDERKHYKIISLDIIIDYKKKLPSSNLSENDTSFHFEKDSSIVKFHCKEGVLKEAVYKKFKSCKWPDLIYFEHIYIMVNGVRKKVPSITFSFR